MTTAKDRLRSAIQNVPENTGLDVRKAHYVSVSVQDLIEVANKSPNHPQAVAYLKALQNVSSDGYKGKVVIDAIDLQALLEDRQSVEVYEKQGKRVVRKKILN